MQTKLQFPKSQKPAFTSRPGQIRLPGSHKAWDFIRRCFDISHKDLQGVSDKTLQRFVAQEKISPELTSHVKAELERFLWNERLPIAGERASQVNTVTRAIVNRVLEVYLALQRELELEKVNPRAALLLLLERVLVPAMFLFPTPQRPRLAPRGGLP